MEHTTISAPGRAVLDDALADAHRTLARTDTTTNTLLTLAGAVLAGISSAAAVVRPAPTVPIVLAGAGTVLLAGAVGALLSAIRPQIGPGGAVRYAAADPTAILAGLPSSPGEADLWLADQLAQLSRISLRKHRRQRLAADLIRGMAVLYVAALAAAAVTG